MHRTDVLSLILSADLMWDISLTLFKLTTKHSEIYSYFFQLVINHYLIHLHFKMDTDNQCNQKHFVEDTSTEGSDLHSSDHASQGEFT